MFCLKIGMKRLRTVERFPNNCKTDYLAKQNKMNIKNILFLIGTPVLSFVFFVFVNGVSYSKYTKSCYENKVFIICRFSF